MAAVSRDTILQDWPDLGDVSLAVLIDQVPEKLVEHRSPNGTNGMDGGQAIGINVHVWVSGKAGRVAVFADTVWSVGCPLAHGIVSSTGISRL